MRVTYDREVDAIYIYLTDEPYHHGEELDEDRRIDYDPQGRPRGIELLSVSHGVNLDGLPAREQISAALERLHVPVFA